MDGIEQWYAVVNRCDRCCTIAISAACLIVWLRPFLRDGRAALRTGAVYAGTLLFLLFIPYSVSGAYLLGSLAAFAAVGLGERQYTGQKLFAVAVHYCLKTQASRVVTDVAFIVLVVQGAVHDWGQRHGLALLVTERQWFRAFVVERVLEAALFAGLLYGGVRLMQRLYGRRRERIGAFELALLAAPLVLCIAVQGGARYVDAYREEPWMTVLDGYDKYDWYEVYHIGLTFLGCAVLFLSVYLFRRWRDGQQEERQRELLGRQMTDMQSHIAQVERLYRDMRGLRHDMGNHLTTLRELYDKGEYEAAAQYAEKLGGQIRETTGEVASGNPVTDVILSDRKREMEEKGIVFDCDFHYPQGGNIDAFDLSIILHNALANAIEARPARVSLVSRLVRNLFIIEAANDYDGELVTEAAGGLPVSTKEGEGHGFGLPGIRRVARRYLGDLEVGKERYGGRECFVLRVMLQLPEKDAAERERAVHNR